MNKPSITKLNDRFTDQSFFKALPFEWLAAFSLALGDMADALVVGQSMGVTGLAAVSLALPIFMVINLIMHGMGAGGSIHFAKSLGNGNCDKARQSFSQVFQGTLAIGVLLALLGNVFLRPLMAVLGTAPEDGILYEVSSVYVRMILSAMPLFFASYVLNYYLRNDDNQKLASLGFAVGNVCDLALNLVFVLGLDMGVKGAAWSTIIGQLVSLGIYLPGLIGKKSKNLSFKPVVPIIKEVLRCFKIGVSTSIQYLYQMIFFLLVNNILMRGIGEEGVAIFDVLLNISFLVTYLYEGAAKASQPLISTFCGERNQSGIRRAGVLALICGNVAGVLLCLLFCLFPTAVCIVFGLEGEALLSLGARALRIYCIGMAIAGTIVLLESYYQAQEDEKSALLLATLRGAVVLIPCTLLFSFLNIELFWWLFPIVELLSWGIFCLSKIFFRRNKETQNEFVLSRMISGKNEEISALTAELEAFCEEHDALPKQSYYVMMTVEEICLALNENAFTKPENGLIQVTAVATQDGSFELFIRDNAVKFNAFSLATSDKTLDATASSALGMSVIKNKVSEFFYRHYKGFNILYIKI